MLAHKAKLCTYSAQIFQVDNRATRQQLGAVAAVVETKRIIERELARLRSDSVVIESKLNVARDANARVCVQINGLREDRLTFRRLFSSLTSELDSAQYQVENIRHARDEAYAARDRAQNEMRELGKQFELDKLERLREWHVLSQAILECQGQGESADARGSNDDAECGSSEGRPPGGLLTPQEEITLTRKVKRGEVRMARDRAAVSAARAKLEVYERALARLREGMSCPDLRDAIAAFNRYEEERYGKLSACSALIAEIERLAAEVERHRAGFVASGAGYDAIQHARAAHEKTMRTAATVARARAADSVAAAAAARSDVADVMVTLQRACITVGVETALNEMVVSPMPHAECGGGRARARTSLSPPPAGARARVGSLEVFHDDALLLRGEGRASADTLTSAALTRWAGLFEARALDISQQVAATAALGLEGDSTAAAPAINRNRTKSRQQLISVAGGSVRGSFAPATASGKTREINAEAVLTASLFGSLAIEPQRQQQSHATHASAGGSPRSDGGSAGGRPMRVSDLKREVASQFSGGRGARGLSRALKTMRSAAAAAAAALAGAPGAERGPGNVPSRS